MLLFLMGSVAMVATGCGANAKMANSGEDKEERRIAAEEDQNNMNEEIKEEMTMEELGEKQKEGTLTRDNFAEFSAYADKVSELLTVPDGFVLKEVQSDIQQNGSDVVRLRYGRENDNIILNGEHFSAVLTVPEQELLGFITITADSEIASADELPSADETTDITKTFLDKVAPGYFSVLSNLWIDRHDEPLIIDGTEHIISGTKHKSFVPRDQDYAWVIVNKNRDVISFEKGIEWESGRTTEKWLYDNYLESGTLDLFAVRQK